MAGLIDQAGIELLLPEEDVTLEEQLIAVCDWAQAFLAGFAVMQQDLSKASEELQEMLGDIGNITQLEVELEEDSENEASFYVLYEHMKLGVMMAFEEFGQHPQPDRSPRCTSVVRALCCAMSECGDSVVLSDIGLCVSTSGWAALNATI